MSDPKNDQPTAARPPQVTVAGWVTILGSAFLVTGMFEAIGQLRSIESRERMAESLSEPPLDGLGLDVSGALDVIHVVFVVAGALGAAACVLGWFVLQRHKPARLALSVVAVPLFFSGFFSGSIAATLVAVSAMLLWSGPARDWFAGRPVRQPPMLFGSPSGTSTHAPSREAPAPDAASRVDAPHLPPTPPGVASDAPPPYAGYGAPQTASPYAAGASRPPAVVAAAIATWVGVAAGLLMAVAMAVRVVADPAAVRDAVERSNELFPAGGAAQVDPADLTVVLVALCVLLALWALAAAALAVLVVRRVSWARPVLIVSAIMSGLLSFAAIVAVITAVTAVAGIVTAYLLMRPEVGRWFSQR